MPTRTLECPRCGAPVPFEPGARTATCPHCGSELPVGGAAFGRRANAIEEIRGDAGLLARRTAADHLEERMAALLRDRAEVWAQWQREVQSAISIHHAGSARTVESGLCFGLGGALLIAGGGTMFFGASSGIVVALLLAGVAAVGVGLALAARVGRTRHGDREQFIHKVLSEAEDRYGPQVAAMDSEIRSLRERVSDLRRELDRLAWDLSSPLRKGSPGC